MKKGISIISPASGALKNFPNRVQCGKKFLEEQGLIVNFERNSLENESYYSANIEKRIDDIYAAIDNKQTDIIMASIGGYNSNQLLSYLDYDRISRSKKIFCGYSDITALILAIYSKTGKIVIHGPTFLPEICGYPRPYEYTWKNFINVVNHNKIEYKEPNFVIKEFIDWKQQEIKFKEIKQEKNSERWTISKNGTAQGKIIGGNLSTILTIIGTEYLPLDIMNEKILFLEDTDITIAEFDSFMQSLKLRGVFDRIKGLIIGKFEDSKNNIEIKEFIDCFFKEYNYPIIYNVDLGHTNPMISIPIGAEVLLSCNQEIIFKILKY